MTSEKMITPPKAKQKSHETKIHGHVLKDSYYWLRERENEEVLEYLKTENAFTDANMASTKELQKKIYNECLARIKETDLSVPVKKDAYFYYSRTKKGEQYPIFCRKFESLEANEEILLDINEEAKGHEYFDLGSFSVSPNHQLLAYSADKTGAEVFTLYVKDLQTKKLLGDRIEKVGSGLVWAEDNQTFFYNVLDEAKRPYKLFRHELGKDPKEDPEVYHEKDEMYFLNLHKTKDRKYIILDLSSKLTSEQRFIDATKPLEDFRIIHPRESGVEYSVEHHKDRFFIVTNDEALNYRLMEAPDKTPSKNHWKEVIPHRSKVKLDDIEVFKDYLVVFEREHGLEQVQVVELKTGDNYSIEFEEAVYTVSCGANPMYDTEILRFGYASLVTPNAVFDFNLRTKQRELKKQQEVLGGYRPSAYTSERILVPSHDGVRIPLSLVYKKGLEKKGQNPFYLNGYGAYGISLDPSFGSNRLSLLDRGFIIGIAHTRGGGEMGKLWEDEGKLMKKKNTFLDFIACAEYAVKSGYTSPEKLVIAGGSAGGLLVGAAVNARPDLFHAAILDVPFVDVVNTMLDKNLPLTVTEYEEWGNPEEKQAFDYMLSYSPYDNLEAKAYPHMLVTGGLHDPRVQYWEPAKWTAKLRELKTDDHRLLLKMNMSAGHGGPTGRYEFLREVAFHYAFFLMVLGIKA